MMRKKELHKFGKGLEALIPLTDENYDQKETKPHKKPNEFSSTIAKFDKPYEIFDLNGDQYIGIQSLKAHIVHYDASKDDLLPDKIYKVDTSSEKSILDFCNRYGVLQPSKGTLFGDESKLFLSQKLDSFIEDVTLYKQFFALYYGLLHDDKIILIRKIMELMDRAVINDGVIFPRDESTTKTLKKMEKFFVDNPDFVGIELIKETARPLLALITEHMRNIHLTLDFDENGHPYSGIRTTNLLDVAYYKLYNIILSETWVNRCQYCGSLFIARKADAKFCSPEKAGKNSPCRNAYEQMKFRYRKKVAAGKMTIEEVAKKTWRPIKEVQSWFEGFDLQEFAKRMKEKEDQQD